MRNDKNRLSSGSRKGRKSSGQSRPWAGRRSRLSIEGLEGREMLAVTTFQNGFTPAGAVDAYQGTQDTILYSITPDVNFGSETGLSPDQQDANGVRQGLMRFDGIFGTGPGQIPLGSRINSATLSVTVFNDSNSSMQMSLYRMRSDWNEATATWNTFGQIGGVQASENESYDLPPDAILFDPSNGTRSFDVTTSLKHWSVGESNLGWLIESAATNGWDFNSSEAAAGNRPVLTVDWTAPSGAGTFEFLDLRPFEVEGDSGTRVAQLPVARLGGSTGTVFVNYSVTAGTAGASDFVATNGTLEFGPGVTELNVPITINGDTLLEGDETINVTISGATIAPGRGAATVTIADDDALINEVLANVTSGVTTPFFGFVSEGTNETNREYVELIGTPGASLDGYYFVVFEGEEEENSGAGTGRADFVVNLQGQTFGSNGLLVITPTNWAYTAAPGTNRMIVPALDAANGLLEDSSQTYALIRSPNAPMVQGTDYDTVGAYEVNAVPQYSIGTGVGILDQLPAGASMVDSVGVVEGGGGDRDRVLTTAERNHPGVHVHHPFSPSQGASADNVTSDAVSRREGQRLPNSIGAWFNGDIYNAVATPIRYPVGAPSSSVVTPLGAVLTPGTTNTLRNVQFTVTQTSVDESAGTVSLTVERTGDTSQAIQVGFTTVNGTAVGGQDFTAASGTLNFGIGVATQPITISILSDSVAEGFETFRVNLTSATNPFVVTRGSADVTIVDGDVLVQTFRDGVNGYNGTRDTTLDGSTPQLSYGFAGSVTVDQDRGEGEAVGTDIRPQQGLLRFDDLFGPGANQVPLGSQVFSGFLTLNIVSPSAGSAEIRFHTMLQDWNEPTATWESPRGFLGNEITNGVTPDGVEASNEADTVVTLPATAGLVQVPLNRDTLQAWANGAKANFGWSIVSDSPDSWSFGSSDDVFSANPILPQLTILYTAPTGQGSFGFTDDQFVVNENGTATVTLNRSGGGAGSATVNYSISAGTATLGDITSAATGSVVFGPNEFTKSFTVAINNDTAREANELLNLSLSGAGLTFDRSSATLEIRDNDFAAGSVLLNELFINSPGNDGQHEYAEISAAAGVGLGSLYFVVLDGDTGEGEGSSDLVVDLGAFLNGSNGFSVVGSPSFDFTTPAGATLIGDSRLDVEALANDSGTYAIVYSPTTPLFTGSFDYDWDNDGILDLPAGAVIVDSIAVIDNGTTDTSYGPTTNRILSAANPGQYVADAVSRQRGNTSLNSAAAWFHGDLVAQGDDPLVYATPNVTALPSTGAALSPGYANTGNSTVSPLVSLTSVVPNANGTVSLNFSGPVSNVLAGGGVPGVTITNADGTPNVGVNLRPNVTGLYGNTLTLTFTGPSVTGGVLPAGSYRLNFSGTAIVGNGRAVDTANSGTPGSNSQFALTIVPSVQAGDFSGDGRVDGADLSLLLANWGGAIPTVPSGWVGDQPTGPSVDADELSRLLANWGFGTSTSFGTIVIDETADAAGSDEESLDAAFAFLGASFEESVTPAPLASTLSIESFDEGDLLLIRDSAPTSNATVAENALAAPSSETVTTSGRGAFKPGVRGLRG